MARRSDFGSILTTQSGRYRGRYRRRGKDYDAPLRPSRRLVGQDLTKIHASILDGTWEPPSGTIKRTTLSLDETATIGEWYEHWYGQTEREPATPPTPCVAMGRFSGDGSSAPSAISNSANSQLRIAGTSKRRSKNHCRSYQRRTRSAPYRPAWVQQSMPACSRRILYRRSVRWRNHERGQISRCWRLSRSHG